MSFLRRLVPRSRRARIAAAAGVVVLVGAAIGGAIYLYRHRHPGSVYHPNAPFTPQASAQPKRVAPDRFAWPIYGYTPNHARYFAAPAGLRPPFHMPPFWIRPQHALLEFPPVMVGSHIFQLADDGVLSAINKHTGHLFWTRKLGQLSASTPAATATVVYAAVLASNGGTPGRIFALDYKTGKTIWSKGISSPVESSPLLDHGRVYFGSQSGTVYAMDARTGAVVWTYHAAGAVKASPTLSGGTLYFGDYSGTLQAVSAGTGRRIWSSGSGGGLLGGGTFYSTAAVMYGRVFLGNTDGRFYAYDAATGRLDWAVQTGAYVYSSPAVTNAPGIGPTVYFGSYDGTFYALNARSGAVSWTFPTHGRISGSPTIVGRVVYFADLGEHASYGLGISTGKKLFRERTGSFDPVISDGVNIYLTGYTGLYAFTPR
jgi:outer membrane protein assembly factor BamB